jgi:uncharacterized protein (DUF305 family)
VGWLTLGGAVMVVTVALVMLVAAPGGSTASGQDRNFVAALVPHHRLGVQLIESAARQADDVRLRRLAFEMSYHDHELHLLERQLHDWDLVEDEEFPGRLDDGLVAYLDTATGPDHDVVWLQSMITHHDGAIALAEQQQQGGVVASLRMVAEQTITVQGRELAAMRELLARLCIERPVAACSS